MVDRSDAEVVEMEPNIEPRNVAPGPQKKRKRFRFFLPASMAGIMPDPSGRGRQQFAL
jgi:hypothetical protein